VISQSPVDFIVDIVRNAITDNYNWMQAMADCAELFAGFVDFFHDAIRFVTEGVFYFRLAGLSLH
jgi:hypothetical protein